MSKVTIFQKKIRQTYYAGSILILIVAAVILSLPIYFNIKNESQQKLSQLEESILNQKQFYLETVIVEKIGDIELIQRRLKREHPDLNENEFNLLFRQSISELIYNTKLPDAGYIWINEIINYDGGDQYAIRTIHPNLPETEGEYLSTKTEDIKGNLPYLEELEGIKSSGDVYLDYYFKKMNSDMISHKLSYGKLYEPFNWVISTGVYLDDVDELIKRESADMVQSTNKTIWQIFLTIFGTIIVLIGTIILFEVKIQQLIKSYMDSMEQSNLQLVKEKDKLKEAYSRIEEIAAKDSLTGLLTRRAIYIYLQDEQARFDRTGSPFGILLCDIDWFKKINDDYGHPAGDYILKEIAEIFKSNIRREDKVCRWGGEEFLFLITNANSNVVWRVAEKLRRTIEDREFLWNNIPISLTITIGLAISEQGKSIDQSTSIADERLYKGKKQGRNTVVGL